MELISSLNDHSPKPCAVRCTGSRGFSLIELMAVSSLLLLLAASLLPAVHSLGASSGRKGSLNILMNAFEQARMAALSTGQTVYVAFGPEAYSDPATAAARFVIFRDTTDEERTHPFGMKYVVLKNWTSLPAPVRFAQAPGTLIGPDEIRGEFPGLNEQIGSRFAQDTFPFLSFNGSGAISQPADGHLRLALSQWASAGGPATSWGAIYFSRSTGCAQVAEMPSSE